MSEEKSIDLIDQYLTGNLSDTDMVDFELKLKSNPDFVETLDFIRDVKWAATESAKERFQAAVRESLRNITETQRMPSTLIAIWRNVEDLMPVINLRQIVAIAASVAVLVTFTGTLAAFTNKPLEVTSKKAYSSYKHFAQTSQLKDYGKE